MYSRLKLRAMLRLLLVLVAAGGGSATAAEQSAAETYLKLLDDGLETTRAQMPAIVASAEEAAQRFIEHGRIYLAGPQEDFVQEAYGRAGGLMSAVPLVKGSEQRELRGSIVLYARSGALDESDVKSIERLKGGGAYVVAFSSRSRALRVAPDALIDSGAAPGLAVRDGAAGKICPTDTLMNAVNLWTWTAELAGACTRLGKMPVFYESYGMPGGKERARRYAGKVFHEDLRIAAYEPSVLGLAYLDAIDGLLQSLREKEMKSLLKAADWWRRAGRERSIGWTIEHMFPHHFQDARAPQRLTWRTWSTTAPSDLDGEAFLLVLGYQLPPEAVIRQASERGSRIVYVSVKPSAQSAERILHVDASWPLPDGCVEVQGYDVPILPASGVIDAAIYWATLAEACAAE